MDNINPEVFESSKARPVLPDDTIDDVHDEIDAREVFGKNFLGSDQLSPYLLVQCSLPLLATY